MISATEFEGGQMKGGQVAVSDDRQISATQRSPVELFEDSGAAEAASCSQEQVDFRVSQQLLQVSDALFVSPGKIAVWVLVGAGVFDGHAAALQLAQGALKIRFLYSF